MAIDTAVGPQFRREAWPTERRWMVIVGAAIMAALMLIGAFSIGIWVGSGRSENPALFGVVGGRAGDAGQRPLGQGDAAGGGQAVLSSLSRAPDLVGTIQSFSGSTIAIGGQNGPQVLTLNHDTLVYLPDGNDGSVEDLARGRTVAVVGAPGDDGRSFMIQEAAVLARAQ